MPSTPSDSALPEASQPRQPISRIVAKVPERVEGILVKIRHQFDANMTTEDRYVEIPLAEFKEAFVPGTKRKFTKENAGIDPEPFAGTDEKKCYTPLVSPQLLTYLPL